MAESLGIANPDYADSKVEESGLLQEDIECAGQRDFCLEDEELHREEVRCNNFAMVPDKEPAAVLAQDETAVTDLFETGLGFKIVTSVSLNPFSAFEDIESGTDSTSKAVSEDILANELNLLKIEEAISISPEETLSNAEDSEEFLSKEDASALPSSFNSVSAMSGSVSEHSVVNNGNILRIKHAIPMSPEENLSNSEDSEEFLAKEDASALASSFNSITAMFGSVSEHSVVDNGNLLKIEHAIPISPEETLSNLEDSEEFLSKEDASALPSSFNSISAMFDSVSEHSVVNNGNLLKIENAISISPEETLSNSEDSEEFLSKEDASALPPSFNSISAMFGSVSEHSVVTNGNLLKIEHAISISLEETLSNTEDSEEFLSKEDARASPSSFNSISAMSGSVSEHSVVNNGGTTADDIIAITLKASDEADCSTRKGSSGDLDLGDKTIPKALQGKTMLRNTERMEQGCHENYEGRGSDSIIDTRRSVSSQNEVFNAARACERDNSARDTCCSDLDLGVQTKSKTLQEKTMPSSKEEWQQAYSDEKVVVAQDTILRSTSKTVVTDFETGSDNTGFLTHSSCYDSGMAAEGGIASGADFTCNALANELTLLKVEEILPIATDQTNPDITEQSLSVNKISDLSDSILKHSVPKGDDSANADNIVVITVTADVCEADNSPRKGSSCDLDLGDEIKSEPLGKALPGSRKEEQWRYQNKDSGSNMCSDADTGRLDDKGNNIVLETTDICERDRHPGKCLSCDLELGVETLQGKMMSSSGEEWQQGYQEENGGSNTTAVLGTAGVCETVGSSREALSSALDSGVETKSIPLQETATRSSEEEWGQGYQEKNAVSGITSLERAEVCSSPRKRASCDLDYIVKTKSKTSQGKAMQSSKDEWQQENGVRNGDGGNGAVLEAESISEGGHSPRKVFSCDLDLGVKRELKSLQGQINFMREEEGKQGYDDKNGSSNLCSKANAGMLHDIGSEAIFETTDFCEKADSPSCQLVLGVKTKSKSLQGKRISSSKEEWQRGYHEDNGGNTMDNKGDTRMSHVSRNMAVLEAAVIRGSDNFTRESSGYDLDLGAKKKSKQLQREMVLKSEEEWQHDDHDKYEVSSMENHTVARRLHGSGNEAVWEKSQIKGFYSASSGARIQPSQQRKKRLDLGHQFVREIVKIQHDREQYDKQIQERQASGYSGYKALKPAEQHNSSGIAGKNNLKREIQKVITDYASYSSDKQAKEPHMNDVQKKKIILSVESKARSQYPIEHNNPNVPKFSEEACKKQHQSAPINPFPDASHFSTVTFHKKECVHDSNFCFDFGSLTNDPTGNRYKSAGLDSQASVNSLAKGTRLEIQPEAVKGSLFEPCGPYVVSQTKSSVPDCQNIKVTFDTRKQQRHIEFVDPASLDHLGRQQQDILFPRSDKKSEGFASDIKLQFHRTSGILTGKRKSVKQRGNEYSMQNVHPQSFFSNQPNDPATRRLLSSNFNEKGKMLEVDDPLVLRHESLERSEEREESEGRSMKHRVSPQVVNLSMSKKHLNSMKKILTPSGEVESRQTLHAFSKMQEVESPHTGCEKPISFTGMKQNGSRFQHLSEDVTCFPIFKSSSTEVLPDSVIELGDSDAHYDITRAKRDSMINNKNKDYRTSSGVSMKDKHSLRKNQQVAHRKDRELSSETSHQDGLSNIAAEKFHNSVKLPCTQLDSLQLEESIISASRFSGRWADVTDDSPDGYDFYKGRINFTSGTEAAESVHPADSNIKQISPTSPEACDTRFDFEASKDVPQHILRLKKQNLDISTEHLVAFREETDTKPNYLLNKAPVKKNVWVGSKAPSTSSILGPARMASILGPAPKVGGLPLSKTTPKSVERGAAYVQHHFTTSIETSNGEDEIFGSEDAKIRNDIKESPKVVVQAYKDRQKRSKRELYVPRRGFSS